MKSIIPFFLLGVFFLASCKYEKTFEAKEVKGKFSMEVPDYLNSCSDLSDEAIFQYKNKYRSFYVIVIEDEKKTKDLRGYADEEVLELAHVLVDSTISRPERVNLNGTEGFQYIVTGKLDVKFVYYIMTYVESAKARYQIVSWTLDEKKSAHLEDINYIINSFKEI